MATRPRIDLDGVSLVDESGPSMVLAVFRYRTTEGLILLLPESADLLVPWDGIEATALDLKAGTLRVTFTKEYAGRQSWLRGARVLAGTWTDRLAMTRAASTS